MKLSPVQILSFCCALLLSAVFVIISVPCTPEAGPGGYMVRMPVDPRIIDLETLEAESLLDNGTTSVPAAKSPEQKKTAPAAVSRPSSGKAKAVAKKNLIKKPEAASKTKASGKSAAQSKSSPAKKVSKKSPKKTVAAGGTIRNLSLKANEDGSLTISAQTSAQAPKVTYMRLTKPDRLVVDILGRWTLRGPNVVRLAKAPVRHLVAGQHKDRLRLVVHFRSALPKQKPVIHVDKTGVTVTVPAK